MAGDPAPAAAGDPALARARRNVGIALGLGLAAAVAVLAILDPPWSQEGGPAFFAPDRHRSFHANVRIGLWWAAAANAALAALLIATRRLWIRPEPPAPAPVPRLARRNRRRLWAGLLLAAACGLALRLPLASRSLWWDEGWSVRQVLVGMYLGPEGDLEAQRWSEGGLDRALWYAKKPTNHALYSTAAWFTLGAWRATHPGPPHRLDELAFRLPALLAAVGTILGVGWLAARLALQAGLAPWALTAGVAAALLLALHPWHVRHGTEGRAYTFVMLFATASAPALLRWLEARRWSDLAAYAGAQALMLWTWSYSIFVTLGLGAAVLVAIARAGGSLERRAALAARFAVANLVAGMAVLQVFAPNLTLALLWEYEGPVWSELPGVFAGLAAGVPWRAPPGFPDLAGPGRWAGAVAVVAVALFGAVAVVRAGGPGRTLALGWLAALPLSTAVTHALGRYFYPRFELFLLPVVVALAAAGAVAAAAWLGRRTGRGFASALPWLALVGFAVLAAPQLRLLVTRPIAPLRNVAEHVARDPRTLRGGTGFGAGMVKIYDPHVVYLDGPADVAAFCRRAAAEDRPLRLFYGHPGRNARGRAGIDVLEDPRWFELERELHGVEADFRYRVFRPREAGRCPPGGGGGDA